MKSLLGSVLVASALLAGCGGDDGGCPTADCTLKGRTVVKWTFDVDADRKFPGDSCVDFGVQQVKVQFVDSMGGVQHLIEDCGVAQVTFSGLEPGDYTVYVTPLDAAGNPLVTEATAGTISAGTHEAPTETTVNIPFTSWIGTFTGTLLFRISWSGVSCELATPVITEQTIKLVIDGVTQTVVTDDGQTMDGMDKKPCRKLSENFPQAALQLPFGPATLVIDGFDATGMMFETSFETFIGAGITNPTLTFDVPLM